MINSFPPPNSGYDRGNEASFRDLVRRAIGNCFSRNQDVDIGLGRLILKDVVTGDRYSISMVNGVLTETAI